MKLASIHLSDVWTALGGGPLRGKRGQAFYRDGDGYSVALDVEKGTWYDHREGRGGGALALVEFALGCDRRMALQWLESNCGLDGMKPSFVDRHRSERHDSADVRHFSIAAKALAEEVLEGLEANDSCRIHPTGLLGIIRAGGAGLIDEYHAWLDADNDLTRAMVHAGASSRARIQRSLAIFLVEFDNAA